MRGFSPPNWKWPIPHTSRPGTGIGDAEPHRRASAEEENADWLGELEKATGEAEYYKQENAALRLQLDALRAHLIRQSGESLDKEIPIPTNYKVMGEWVKEHLTGRLVLLPRAERAASKVEYTEVEMVYGPC